MFIKKIIPGVTLLSSLALGYGIAHAQTSTVIPGVPVTHGAESVLATLLMLGAGVVAIAGGSYLARKLKIK